MGRNKYQTRGRTRRSWWKLKLFTLLVVCGATGYYFQEPLRSFIKPTVEDAPVVALSKYDVSTITLPDSGQSAVAIYEDTLNIHASGDQLWPMASITKIITALAILDKAPMQLGEQGDTITLNQQDEQYYWDYAALDGTLTPVTAGFEMSQYEVLQTMLLASSNNMTDTLVDNYFADRDEFLRYTNALLESYGLTYTRVADATGFSPQSVSTPTEMIHIGKRALDNPVIAEIMKQPSATPRVAGLIPNYNILIDQPGVTGIKLGLTDESGYNLLFSAETTDSQGEPIAVIAVVMGIFDRQSYFMSTQSLLESAKELAAAQ